MHHTSDLFGIEVPFKEAKIAILPMPWDVTTSYKSGTSAAPLAILEASLQMDLTVYGVQKPWQVAVHLLPLSRGWHQINQRTRALALPYISHMQRTSHLSASFLSLRDCVNGVCEGFYKSSKEEIKTLLKKGKVPAILGGEHSVALSTIECLVDTHNSIGILHIDAHMDLREAYMDLTYSHASLMYNVLSRCKNVSITQVGQRDFSPEELAFAKQHHVHLFEAHKLHEWKCQGKSWEECTECILSTLPKKVYISFDIDGLSVENALHTGTPVVGGLSFEEIDFLLRRLAKSGKKIVGFDLCEVVPSQNALDQTLAAQLLYRLCVYTSYSQQWLR